MRHTTPETGQVGDTAGVDGVHLARIDGQHWYVHPGHGDRHGGWATPPASAVNVRDQVGVVMGFRLLISCGVVCCGMLLLLLPLPLLAVSRKRRCISRREDLNGNHYCFATADCEDRAEEKYFGRQRMTLLR